MMWPSQSGNSLCFFLAQSRNVGPDTHFPSDRAWMSLNFHCKSVRTLMCCQGRCTDIVNILWNGTSFHFWLIVFSERKGASWTSHLPSAQLSDSGGGTLARVWQYGTSPGAQGLPVPSHFGLWQRCIPLCLCTLRMVFLFVCLFLRQAWLEFDF